MNRKCKEGSPAAILMKGHHKVSGSSAKESHREHESHNHEHHHLEKAIKRAAGGAGKTRKDFPYT